MKRGLFGFCLAFSSGVVAAPHEIKVSTDELVAHRGYSVETHINKASRSGPAAGKSERPLQLMPEYSYGIRPNWQMRFTRSLSRPARTVQVEKRQLGHICLPVKVLHPRAPVPGDSSGADAGTAVLASCRKLRGGAKSCFYGLLHGDARVTRQQSAQEASPFERRLCDSTN